MIRGTTPTHIFNVNVDLTDADVIYITYKQSDSIVVEKEKSDCTITADSVSVTLSQEDTLKFNTAAVEIQIRARFPDGSAIASNIMQTTATRILKGGVI